jgi:hypothetical protein
MACSNPCVAQQHNLYLPTPASPPSSISEAISQLQATWHSLHFVDRARELNSLVNAGLKKRYLARELDCSDGTIRLYLTALQAEQADIELARRNEISLRELIRRATGHNPSDGKPEERTCETEPAIVPVADAATILSWLGADPVRAISAPVILQESIHEFQKAERNGFLPCVSVPAGMAVEEVIERCRPNPDNYDHYIAWYTAWMCFWVVCLIPETAQRWDALNSAVQRVQNPGNTSSL